MSNKERVFDAILDLISIASVLCVLLTLMTACVMGAMIAYSIIIAVIYNV